MTKIRSNFVQKSIMDYEKLAQELKENAKTTVKSLLDETVRDTYNQILSEASDEEYEETEIDDNGSEGNETDGSETESDATGSETTEGEATEGEEGEEEGSDAEEGLEDVEDSEEAETPEEDEGEDVEGTDAELDGGLEDDSEGWSEFDKYKVSDDTYNFSDANDEELIKVYKLLKGDDNVVVNTDSNNNVTIKDNENGAEYLVTIGDNGGEEKAVENEFDDSMNESTIFEVVLEDKNMTMDDYQKKDVISGPKVRKPKGKDWDKGVKISNDRPWPGNAKAKSAPFNEEEEVDGADLEEATNVGGFVQQNTVSKSHIPNSNGRKARNASVAGKKEKSTSEPRYSGSMTAESVKKIMDKANKIFNENKELKKTLVEFNKTLEEAVVTNFNLGQIVRLFTENSTTADEKKAIVNRFANEAKTVEQAKTLAESINNELKKKTTLQINEDKQFTTNGSQKINESTIYKSKDLIESLDLMHRVCK